MNITAANLLCTFMIWVDLPVYVYCNGDTKEVEDQKTTAQLGAASSYKSAQRWYTHTQ